MNPLYPYATSNRTARANGPSRARESNRSAAYRSLSDMAKLFFIAQLVV